MPNYAPRVSIPFTDLSGVIKEWATTCEEMVVYEHPADEEVATTHVHLIMINSKYKTAEQLKKIFRKLFSTDRDGNDLWSWTHKTFPNPDLTYITYMSKGNLEPVYIHKTLSSTINEFKLKWVEPKNKPSQTNSKGAANSKGEAAKTHWAICSEIISLGHKEKKMFRHNEDYSGYRKTVDASGNTIKVEQLVFMDEVFANSLENWDIMCKILDKYQVRTSRNELERFWVTILRQSAGHRASMFEQINKNIFR